MYENKKIMCILLILLLILGSTVPNVNSIKIIKSRNSGVNEEDTNSKNYYLAINFSKLEYVGFEEEDDFGYAIYNVEYTVKNIGDRWVSTRPVLKLESADNESYLFCSWGSPFSFLFMYAGREKTYSHDIKIKSDKKDKYNGDFVRDERFFADQDIILDSEGEIGAHPDDSKSNIECAKYYSNDENYVPTLAHLLINTPWKYEEIEVNTLSGVVKFPKIIINDELPEILTNQRLGWINEFKVDLGEITDKINLILNNENESFVNQSANSLRKAIVWVYNVSNCFKNFINETCNYTRLLELFNNFEDTVNDSIAPLTNLSEQILGDVIKNVSDLNNSAQKLIGLIKEKVWEKPIKVKGTIKNLRRGETVKIRCRGQLATYKDEDDGNKDHEINYEFTVPSDFIYGGNNYFEPHECKITIEGNRHCKKVESIEILSYCYSNGTIVKNIGIFDWFELRTLRR